MNPFSITQAAKDSPGHCAVVCGTRSWTFPEMAAGAERAADWLAARDLAPHALVAFTPRPTLASLHMLYALFTLNHPIALLHPRWIEAERRALVTAWKPDYEITDESWAAAPSDAHDLDAGGGAASTLIERSPREPQAPLAIVPTSGSSAVPKGVVLSVSAFAAAARAHALNIGWQEDDRWLLSLPLAHVGGLSIVTRCLQARRTLVLPEAESGAGFEHWAASVAAQRVSILSLVPTQLRQWLDLEPGELPRSVRAILLGGAPASAPLLERAAGRRWPVLPSYGLTEACAQVATREYARRFEAASDVGQPLDGVELRVTAGEIFLRGPQLFDGYYPSGQRPFDADGWFGTGDLGELDAQGRLSVYGRKDDVIISGGENVHPLEVERCLLAHPGVTQVCVFGVPDAHWGQRVVAAVVARAASELSAGAVLEFAREHLASFRRPRQVIVLDALPLNAIGKVDRRGLAARFSGPQR